MGEKLSFGYGIMFLDDCKEPIMTNGGEIQTLTIDDLSPSPDPSDLSCITSERPKEISFDLGLSEEQITNLIRIMVKPVYRRSNNWLKMHKYPMRRKGIDIYNEIDNSRKPVTDGIG